MVNCNQVDQFKRFLTFTANFHKVFKFITVEGFTMLRNVIY